METQVIEKTEETLTANLPEPQPTCPRIMTEGKLISTRVVGVTFENRQEVISKIQMGERVWLETEPDNRYDANAIKVCRSNGEQMGYLNRHLAARIIPYFRAYGYPVKGKVTLLTGSYQDGYSLGCIVTFALMTSSRTKNSLPTPGFDDWDD